MDNYSEFFRTLTTSSDGTAFAPYPYQAALAEQPWPDVLDIPTGLGKTAAVLGAFLWKRLRGDPDTGRRLVYCLPMRTLVHQTAGVAELLCRNSAALFDGAAPTVHVLMGGDVDDAWERDPVGTHILIGTQDMLLSRALNRGYGMSRFRWPLHFGLLNNDCLWVLDEIQLMGVAVETSSQLAGFRRSFGTNGPSRTLWMSATVGRAQLSTVDHREPAAGFEVSSLESADHDVGTVVVRVQAVKRLVKSPVRLDSQTAKKNYAPALAARIAEQHQARGGLTLVVLNQVKRAQDVYRALSKLVDPTCVGLVHSRFRGPDRALHEALLTEATGDRIVVATQAVEAGVDVSARTLITELAPWSSLVQRFGRLNRAGEVDDAVAEWIDIVPEAADKHGAPYEPEDLDWARMQLIATEDVGPASLRAIDYTPPLRVRPVLRRRDLLELFDTTPDLSGNDIDIARFIRDGEDTDVQVYFRDLGDDDPDNEAPPSRDELCRVSIGGFNAFISDLTKAWKKQRATSGSGPVPWLRAYVWDAHAERFSPVTRAWPGQMVLLDGRAGGYTAALGWTGEAAPKTPTEVIAATSCSAPDSLADDPDSYVTRRWIPLADHLGHVEAEARRLAMQLSLDEVDDLALAGRWHDVGKAHHVFQDKLLSPVADDPTLQPTGAGPWAKSSHSRRHRAGRPYFRHELASALAWLQAGTADSERQRDLVMYLVAAHHGKIRVSIRSLPGEQRPPDSTTLFARGVWDGDDLPEVTLPDGSVVPKLCLDLGVMALGRGSFTERVLGLRDAPDMGLFRLALLELVVRIADWTASAAEQEGNDDA